MDHPRSGVVVDSVTVPGAGARLGATTFTPFERTAIPMLMIHENRGMVPYMLDVGVALAEAGHEVVAPDLLSRIGGTSAHAEDPTSATTREIPEDTHEADLLAVYDWMTERHSHVGIIGFCFGGEMGWRVITHRTPDRAVLFYGIGPSPEAVSRIACATYAVYAQDDPRVNDTLPPLCDALVESGAEVTLESFPDTRHAFHDHTRPERYHPVAAAEVWQRTLRFLDPAS